MSSTLENAPVEKSLPEQLADLDATYQTRRAELEERIAMSYQEAQNLAKNDIHLEHDPVAQEAARTGKDARGEMIPDLLGFLRERRQENIDRPNKGTSGRRRAEDLPSTVRADDPKIWEKGSGNR